MTQVNDYPDCQPLNEKLSDQPDKIIHLFAGIIMWCAKFSQFEKYFTKHRKIQICMIMKTNARYKIHNKSHSAKQRLMHMGLC
jgi:hypothetical protein